MAGGIADRKKDRLIGRGGLVQGCFAPGAPMDRVVLMLKEIGACFPIKDVL